MATISAANSRPSTPGSHFSSLQSQVGGHPGVLASDDGAVIVKPALATEVAFYSRIAEGDPALSKLRPFLPSFYGTLQLAGSAAPEGLEAGLHPPPTDVPDTDKSCIVLENIAAAFSKPNILDIKLGTVLYDDNASPEKRERMLKSARESTSLETGVRITGFQVYGGNSSEATVYPKTYGRSLKVGDLPEAFRRFFPLNASEEARAFTFPPKATLERIKRVNSQETTDAPKGSSLPASLLVPVLHGILTRTKSLREVLAQTEIRLVGSSLLVVYEADWERVAQHLHTLADSEKDDNTINEASALDADGTIVSENDGYAEDDETGSSGSGDSEESSEEEDGLPYSVSLIDFAHTKVVSGEGPDNRVLLGLDTTIRLLETRLAEVKSESRNISN